MKFNLPNDIRRHVRHKVLKRVVSWFLFELILGGVLILWGEQIFRAGSWPALKAICYCIILVIPCAVCGVPFKLIDRTWRGVVEKVEIKTTYDHEHHFKPTWENVYLKNTIFLAVTLPDQERVIRKKVYAGRAKQQQHLNSYKKGDKVFHLYGTPHTVVLPSPSDTHVQCAVCGDMNDISEKTENKKMLCRNCHLTLIADIA